MRLLLPDLHSVHMDVHGFLGVVVRGLLHVSPCGVDLLFTEFLSTHLLFHLIPGGTRLGGVELSGRRLLRLPHRLLSRRLDRSFFGKTLLVQNPLGGGFQVLQHLISFAFRRIPERVQGSASFRLAAEAVEAVGRFTVGALRDPQQERHLPKAARLMPLLRVSWREAGGRGEDNLALGIDHIVQAKFKPADFSIHSIRTRMVDDPAAGAYLLLSAQRFFFEISWRYPVRASRSAG